MVDTFQVYNLLCHYMNQKNLKKKKMSSTGKCPLNIHIISIYDLNNCRTNFVFLIGTTQQLIFDGSNKMMKIIHIYSSNSLPRHLDRGVHHKALTDFVNDFIVLASATRKACSRL